MPSGENPWNELLAKNRRRSKGDLNRLQAKLWHGIDVAEAGLIAAMTDADSGEVRRWLHILHQIAGTYARIVIDADLETRLRAIETSLKDSSSVEANRQT